jgi:hypothetical protein
LTVSVTGRWMTVTVRDRSRSMILAGRRLVVARALPTEDLALWYEHRPGLIGRVLGLRPLELLDEAALSAWRRLDALATRLRSAVAGHGGGGLRAFELGRGLHRVLLVEHLNRMVLYARPLFRERPRRALEVRADGSVRVPQRQGDQVVRCRSRYAVTVLGDRIRFQSPAGGDMASVWLPWIAPEDRAELAERIGDFVHGAEQFRHVAAS